jgi:hypothetical protein
MKNWIVIVGLYILLVTAFQGCKDEEFTYSVSDGISFSSDTIAFDTIFTQIGSVTKRFKVYNRNDKYINLSKVYIKGGNASNFRMSLDGLQGYSHDNISIPPKDSLYIFVEVTLDPLGNNLPLVIYDGIVFIANGNTSEVTLEAFGQDVHLIKGEIIGTETWVNDKPYLIYNSMAVDSNHTLTINEGVRVHFHASSSMIVWGTLKVIGSLENPVVFEGDRFDFGYGESAGRWGTIFIDPGSRGNEINYAIIKNATAGFQVGEPGDNLKVPSLVLRNTFILNTSFASIIAFGAEINAYNSIFSDSQYHGLALMMGGKYNFYHSTISIVGALKVTQVETKFLRKKPSYALVLSNWQPYYTLDDNFIVVQKTANNALLQANFYNSIIYGSHDSPNLEFTTADNEETAFNYFFDHCLIKQAEDSIDVSDVGHFKNVRLNEYPRFINDSITIGELNYRLDTLSPAKDAGLLDIVNNHLEFLQYDYDGNLRTADGKPDLGAFERQE